MSGEGGSSDPAIPPGEQISEVINAVSEGHPEWPYTEERDTVKGDPWPLAWDAAAFIEEWFAHPDHNDLEEAVCYLPIKAEKFGYNVTDWHYKKLPTALLKAHLLRIVKGWSGETKLHAYLDNCSDLVDRLGFEDGLPSQSTLWRVWNKDRLTDDHKQILTTIGQVLVNIAREHDVPAPDEVFYPDPSADTKDVEQDDESVREKTISKTKKVWQHSKSMVTENYELKRGQNRSIHENSFWEAHAFMGARTEMYAEDGTTNFAADTTRDRVQSGSNHRFHMMKHSPDQARQMHRDTMEDLITRARREGKAPDSVIASIDNTKSNPYRTRKKIERDDENNVTNKWLLGYKEKENESADFYFQWAQIKIVGFDIPLVLDAIPIYRGLSRAGIVDELLEGASELIDIDLVLMDAEFDSDGVKEVCDQHEVLGLNRASMGNSERATCSRLRQQGKKVHVEEINRGDDDDDDESAWKRMYVPAINADQTSDEIDDGETEDDEINEGETEETKDLSERQDEERDSVRDELEREWGSVFVRD